VPSIGNFIRWLLAQLALAVILHFLFVQLPLKLVEHAVLTALDDAIGNAVGITVPRVLSFLWNWGLPFLAAGLVLWVYHSVNRRAGMTVPQALKTVSRIQTTYRPTEGELPPQFFRWRWWYEIWAHAPFHSYKARKRLEFMDSWKKFSEQQNEIKIANELAERLPNVRVADSAAAMELFERPESDKLLPLLESEKLSAWGRRMGHGEPPLMKIPGQMWRSHYLAALPRGSDPNLKNQTFVKTNARQETIYYDLYLNREQIRKVWPDFDPASLPGIREGVARVQNEIARATAKMPHSQEPPNLERLFDQDETGFIQLRFMPDTKNKNQDALLLVVYGYKVVGGHDEVKVSTVERSLRRSGGLLKTPTSLVEEMATIVLRPLLDFEEIVRSCVSDGTITKSKLAQGGYLAITEEGMLAAGRLADDLIKRA
jgi:hypothetical protein